MKYITIFLCLLLRYSDQKSTPSDSHYVAAVVEFQLTRNSSIALQEYVHYIKMAAEKNADIVVFPEMTLVRRAESVRVPMYGLLFVNPVPALHPKLYDELLVTISKAARDNDIYVVINIQENMDCNDAPSEYCPEKKIYYFNTNVVFDRTGAVIDRYRKINPFGEATRSPALKPDLGVFRTDFGVTFAHFICFDIMFRVPAIQVVTKLNVKDVIFPTMWFSEMPYLTAVQVQQSYANALNVNMIAANANNIGVGTAGSGVYAGNSHTLVSQISGVPGTKLLVVPVQKTGTSNSYEWVQKTVTSNSYTDTTYLPGQIVDKPTDPDGLLLLKDPELHKRVSKKLGTGNVDVEIKEGEVTCRVKAIINELNNGKSYNYRLFVHHGTNTYMQRRLGVAVCSIVACETEDITSCPYRFSKKKTSLEFERLKLIMTTVRPAYNESLGSPNIIYFPQSLRINKFPLDSSNVLYIEKENSNNDFISYELERSQNDLISFGVWGRMFDKDDPPKFDVTEEDIENYLRIEDIIYKESES